MVNVREIKVICKRCGKTAPSDKFVLELAYRMMVCPNCINELKSKQVQKDIAKKEERKEQIKEVKDVKPKPVGWDGDDDYLEKLYKHKKQTQGESSYERISDTKVRYTCSKCKYKFVYDTEKKYPDSCPYCKSTGFKFGSF
ncbi:MAG: hypothetical protein V1663_01685 [archaeon]